MLLMTGDIAVLANCRNLEQFEATGCPIGGEGAIWALFRVLPGGPPDERVAKRVARGGLAVQ